ncbi:hypothetical protein MKW94_011271 [Papaver nudicaule]|uniref:Cullin-associated NEDD8-dissociated protein 1 n=1 Tax=Papaver nudicaule TaxID=74823 RepID=A0AA41VET7_PAPNU|nr:hypothetical protein [Papaver nudicaule]
MADMSAILEKMTDKDKDLRYMATFDLFNELSLDSLKAHNDLELKISNSVLQQLDDQSRDVSGLAAKCLAPLVKKVSQGTVLEMTEKLCGKLLNEKKDRCRDTAIALKTIVSEIPVTTVAQRILVSLSRHLVKGITADGMPTEIRCECLDVLCHVLNRFGNLMTADHGLLLNSLLPQLSSNQATVRCKSISCIASLASSLSDYLLATATEKVVQLLKNKSHKYEMILTNIQMVDALSRSVGYRFGSHLGETVPVLIDYCKSASEDHEQLREYSLQALESFLLRCPRDISPYCDEILHLALEYLSYDPNFSDDMEEDIDDESCEEEEEEDDEDVDEYADDEDISWKVRRAAAKCLSAIIVSRPEMLSKLYGEACPKLIERFKETEENVKMDVFNTFIELLRQTGTVTKGQIEVHESSPRWLLKQQVSKIIKSVNRQLREKSAKTKVGASSVLRELVVVLPDCLADHIGTIVSGIEQALSTLIITRLVMSSHPPYAFHPYIKVLSAPVLSAVGGRSYKVTAEALRVCEELVRVVRPNVAGVGFDYRPYVHPIYNAILPRLANHDQNQEVKECAISCMGLVISTFGDNLQAELPVCLPLLGDQMGKKITRLPAVRAFALIANSPLKINLSCMLEHLIAKLTAFLREGDRALREATLGTLNSLFAAYGDKIASSAYEVTIAELSALISDSDLHITALALVLSSTLMTDRNSSPNVGSIVWNKVLPQSLTLIRSSLLQGNALQALQSFFVALVHSANTSFDVLIESLLSSAQPSPQSGGLAKQALYSVAQCVAILCFAASDQKCGSTVRRLTKVLKEDCSTNSAIRKDLSSHAGIENIMIEFFQSPSEEIQSAASYALGNIAVGNLSRYLPFILDQIDKQQKKQYLLLHSLKEVIARQSIDQAVRSVFQDSSVEKILKLLFNHCESGEEGVRNVVAECLGKVAMIEPTKVVPALKERLACPAAFTRATVVTAVKYSIVERPEKIDEIMYPVISSFLILIKDHDRHVRRAAVLALSTAAQKKPNLIKGLLPELLPLLYDQTAVKRELIRTVDLGPFKHTVDDGLELRKAAFECVDILLDSCLDQVNPSLFVVPYLKSGLDDDYDVKMTCHRILSKLADKCPAAVLAVLDYLVDSLQKTINYKPKPTAVKQEVDRNEDMVRSALRAVSSLSQIRGADCSLKFKSLMSEVAKFSQ